MRDVNLRVQPSGVSSRRWNNSCRRPGPAAALLRTADRNVLEVGFTVRSPDWWCLWATPHDRFKTDWIKVITGWGHETLSLRGETVRLVDDLSRLFGPRGPTPLPLRSLGDLAHVYETLMVELGRRWAIRWAEPLPTPGEVRLPPDARLTVTRTPSEEPSLRVKELAGRSKVKSR